MAAIPSTDVTFWLTTGVPTKAAMSSAPTQGKPTEISASLTGLADGDLVVCADTNWKSVDNVQVASSATNTKFDALGCDSTREAVASKIGTVEHYAADDMTKICPSGFTDNSNTPSTISVATFCDPTATLPGAVTDAGTVELTGYVDACDPSYIALYESYESQDQRYLRIDLGPEQGYLVMPVTALAMNWDLPLEDAVQFTLTFVKGSATRHLFGPCS